MLSSCHDGFDIHLHFADGFDIKFFHQNLGDVGGKKCRLARVLLDPFIQFAQEGIE